MSAIEPKRVLCVQDISCIGRCSLTVLLPVLSAMGLQACPLPTALLSSHLAGFGTPAHTDETAFCRNALAHWNKLGIQFDAVLSGYLADAAQAQLVAEAFRQSPHALKLVDPVMADHGRLYSSATPALCAALCTLCEAADVLTPNMTESAVLLGLPPDGAEHPLTEAEISARGATLAARFPRASFIVITGVKHVDGRCGNVFFAGPACAEQSSPLFGCCAYSGRAVFLPYEVIAQCYPGTGDLFAALLTGGLLTHGDAVRSIQSAADFISVAAKRTLRQNGAVCCGVQFEPLLGTLAAPQA